MIKIPFVRFARLWVVPVAAGWCIPVIAAPANSEKAKCEPRQYIFSWSLADGCLPQPRGGTSTGAPVKLAKTPSPQWQALMQPGLTKYERDRRAILAMAGGYRASFEFVETIGYPIDYALAVPYQSWGTEYIYVVEDRGDFISLQHIMVMYFQEKDGKVSEPMVMKHWRQDWQYQDTDILEYSGNDTWKMRQLDKNTMQGAWSQSVYQVDDSPRYASVGKWQHTGSFSSWLSEDTWRPLPRREHTIRNDYQILEGTNRHVILPTGWVQEEDNLKRQLSANSSPDNAQFVAKELGNNRYQRLDEFDWSAGHTYMKETGPFWHIVRNQWDKLFQQYPGFSLKKQHNDTPLFMALFELADNYQAKKLKNPEQAVSTVLNNYVVKTQL